MFENNDAQACANSSENVAAQNNAQNGMAASMAN